MSKGDVTYLNDIVQELSEEFEMNFDEMKEICTNSLDYIKVLTKEKETMSILLPFLGVMYYSKKIGDFFLPRLIRRKLAGAEDEINTLKYRNEYIENNRTENGSRVLKHTQRPFLYKFKSILKKLGNKMPKGGATLGYKEIWNKVSSIQNEINND